MDYEILTPFEDVESVDTFTAEWDDYCESLREIAECEEIAQEVQEIARVW